MIARRWAHQGAGEAARVTAWLANPTGDRDQAIVTWEKAVQELTGIDYVAAVNSGRRGMTLIFEHLGVGPGDEVIVPAYTLRDLIPLLKGFGARLVPADIDPESYNMTVESVARRISKKTKVIFALHAFGAPADIQGLRALADQHGLPLVEDCAHALGSRIGQSSVGVWGDAAFYSFETNKPVNTYGGGMVASPDPALVTYVRSISQGDREDLSFLAQKLKSIRQEQLLFQTRLIFLPLYMLATPRWNAAMDRLYRKRSFSSPADIQYTAIQAELGPEKLASLPDRVAHRNAIAEAYAATLDKRIRPQRIESGCVSSWFFYVAALPCAAGPIRRRLLFKGIDAGIENEILDDCAALLGDKECPVVADLFPRLLALPMHEAMGPEDALRIARTLNGLIA